MAERGRAVQADSGVRLALALVVAAGPAMACGPEGAWRGTGSGPGGGVTAALVAEPAVRVSEPFALLVTLCGAGAPRLVRVDAGMPAHRHGMNYRPTLSAVGPGVWRAEGMVVHMPGAWEVRLDLEGGGSVRVPVTLR